MVSSSRTASRLTIVARPNQSATWNGNLCLLLALAVPSLAIATAFALRGAWPILPFVGLELCALGAALYLVQWKLQYRQVITVSDEGVQIEKGFHSAQQSWRFQPGAAGLTVTTRRHPWDGPELAIHDHADAVVLGEFLSREDSLKLLTLLRPEIQVRANSGSKLREF